MERHKTNNIKRSSRREAISAKTFDDLCPRLWPCKRSDHLCKGSRNRHNEELEGTALKCGQLCVCPNAYARTANIMNGYPCEQHGGEVDVWKLEISDG